MQIRCNDLNQGYSYTETLSWLVGLRKTNLNHAELEIFSLERVYGYLADHHWWRRVSEVGQISIGGHRYGVGTSYTNQDVRVTFDASIAQFVVEDSHQEGIKRLQPKGLTVGEITGLKPAPRPDSLS